jgi:glutamate/tyrosine decarboxylase-like PLP-dependent enzyme
LKKGMAFLGLGIDNLISVKANSKGKMDVQDLENKILQAQSEVMDTEYWYCRHR